MVREEVGQVGRGEPLKGLVDFLEGAGVLSCRQWEADAEYFESQIVTASKVHLRRTTPTDVRRVDWKGQEKQ